MGDCLEEREGRWEGRILHCRTGEGRWLIEHCTKEGVFQIALETTYWTMINHIFTWGSLGFYFCILFFLYSDGLCLIFPNVFQFLGKALPNVWQGGGK